MDNLDAPLLQPDLPNYPILEQFVRVTGNTIGGGIYPCVVCQYSGSLTMRDREPAYVKEANGTALTPSYYDCRLVGSHLGLPLFMAGCCVSGTFSSSSSG